MKNRRVYAQDPQAQGSGSPQQLAQNPSAHPMNTTSGTPNTMHPSAFQPLQQQPLQQQPPQQLQQQQQQPYSSNPSHPTGPTSTPLQQVQQPFSLNPTTPISPYSQLQPQQPSQYMQPINQPITQPLHTPPKTPPPDGSISPSVHAQAGKRRVYAVDEEEQGFEQHHDTAVSSSMAGMNLADSGHQQPYYGQNNNPQYTQPGPQFINPQSVQQGTQKYPQGTQFTQQPYSTHQQQPHQHHQAATPQQQRVEFAAPTAANQCPTKFMRFTVNGIPSTQGLLSKSSIPLGCVIDPLAPPDTTTTTTTTTSTSTSTDNDDRVPLVNFGSSGIVRCRRCRAYINPFVAFIEAGRRWRCNLCDMPNEVPPEYFALVDPTTGQRGDIRERPELRRGCVEFIAPSEYMVRPPQPPVYFFLIDTCYAAVSSGMFNSVVQGIKESLDELPGDTRTQIGFLTYDRMLHFYNLKSTLSQPQMLVVSDIENVFVPLPDDLLVNLRESRHIVDALLDKLPSMFAHTQQVESAFGPALKAAFNVIRHIGGKLLVFQSNIPLLGPGKLTNREDPKLLGTDKESTLITPVEPAASFYKDYALDCSRQQIGVDLFLFPTGFIDVGTLGVLPQITGGQLYSYPAFRLAKDAETIIADVRRNLLRYTSWEAVIRIRCSRGIKMTAHHGNFFIRSTDLLALPNADEDKTYAVQFAVTENLANAKYSCIQTALLYTTSSGERRIRVLTACLPVISNIGDVFKYADVGAVTNLITKMAIEKVQSAKISDAREAVVNKCIEILAAYKDSFTSATSTSNGQLALPDTLRLLPLYVLAVAKNVLFRPGEVRPDERAFHMYRFKTLGVEKSLLWIYPSLYNLLTMPSDVGRPSSGSDGRLVLPQALNLSSEKLDRRSLFLLDTAYSLIIFVPKGVSAELLLAVFGVDRFDLIPPGATSIPSIDTPINAQIRSLVSALRSIHHTFLRVDIIREGDPSETLFTFALIEDRTRSVTSYVDFMNQLQRSVQNKASK